MSRWLLDTNVVSELSKPRPNERVASFIATAPPGERMVSIVTLAELRHGVEGSPAGSRRAVLEAWLETVVRPRFERSTLPLTETVLIRWRELLEAGRKAGLTRSPVDALIAATALVHGLTVVTRDVRPFVATGAPVLNPWEPEPS